ncbi:hypothetical protein [Naasia sp. SYSU D00057]|uniref:hypothetical protein n=1 Tax=Naasia sp. SYSU D00057 TaxID=2817380 RepID=UPI001B318927|nr:hypothetical protein [Naasia sp. SYSU D00057]
MTRHFFRSTEFRDRAEKLLGKGIGENHWIAAGLAVVVDRLDKVIDRLDVLVDAPAAPVPSFGEEADAAAEDDSPIY